MLLIVEKTRQNEHSALFILSCYVFCLYVVVCVNVQSRKKSDTPATETTAPTTERAVIGCLKR